MVTIEHDASGSRVEDCLALARGLDRGFNDAGLDAMAEELPEGTQFLAVDDGDLLGFASVDEHRPAVAELS
jgi:hypothetical protein